MPVNIVMPRMGQSMEEGRIMRWLKPAGASVERGEPLVEIETDKANVEIEAGASGRLAEILIPEGTVVAVGVTIGLIEDKQVTPAAAVKAASLPGPPVKPPRIPASPLARRLAAELGADLTQITGTGPGARIGKADVLAWLALHGGSSSTVAQPPAVSPPIVSPAAPLSSVTPAHGPQRAPLSKMRRSIGQRMVTSKTTIPHFYLSIDLDMGRVLALRDSLAKRGNAVSLTAILLKATALCLVQHPQLNAELDGEELQYHDQVDLAVAVALEDGLLTPVVPGCQALSLQDLNQALQAVVERARAGRLQPQDLRGGTFTVSNLGMFGIKQFEAIVNPPQAAILALGTVRRVPAFDERGNVVAVSLLTATLSVDHRVVDGADAARFLATLNELVGDGFALL